MGAKFKILKEGKTNINSTDISDFVIHSGYPNVKIKFSGSNNFTLSSGSYQAYHTVTHNLGYIPQAYGWVERNSKIYPCNLYAPTGEFGVKYNSTDDADVMTICSSTTTTTSIGVFIKFPVGATAYTNYTFTAHWRIAVDNT